MRPDPFFAHLAEDGHEVLQLFGGVFVVGEGLSNFCFEGFTVAFAETVDGYFDGAFGFVEALGDGAVGSAVGFAHEGRFKCVEKIAFAQAFIFFTEPDDDGVEQGDCPLPFEDSLGGEGVAELGGMAILGGGEIEGDGGMTAAALLGLASMPFVGQEMLEGREQEGSKFTAILVDVLEIVFNNLTLDNSEAQTKEDR